MDKLIHLIYSSAATYDFTETEILNLLEKARKNNEALNVTGMLLYTDGSFFQVLEGPAGAVDELFKLIGKDERHTQVATIIREPIARRSFGEWTMGYADLDLQDLEDIVGLNDFFSMGSCFVQMDQGRSKKLLASFKDGRWRTKITGPNRRQYSQVKPIETITSAVLTKPRFSFAFQPILDARGEKVFAYEALIRGLGNEPSEYILNHLEKKELFEFDEDCRTTALGLAAKLGIQSGINLNIVEGSLEHSPRILESTLEAAKRFGISPEMITLEINDKEAVQDHQCFSAILAEFRSAGIKIAVDNFGAGRASLTLLDQTQPEMIKFSMGLLKGIETNGPRQAIVRGVMQTCNDLGIDVVAMGLSTAEEYWWLLEEGLELFQGNLFGVPAFEALAPVKYPLVAVY